MFFLSTEQSTTQKWHGFNLCLSSIVTPGVTVAGTTIQPTCPYPPYKLGVYEYSSRDYFTLKYPADGYQVLRGSRDVLTIPADRPQAISLRANNVGLLELGFSVRHAKSASLEIRYLDMLFLPALHPAAASVVSCRQLSLCYNDFHRLAIIVTV